LVPEDSDYDSDDLVSEEEDQEEVAAAGWRKEVDAHRIPDAFDFPLDAPRTNEETLQRDEEDLAVAREKLGGSSAGSNRASMPLKLRNSSLLMQYEPFPETGLALRHQSVDLNRQALQVQKDINRIQDAVRRSVAKEKGGEDVEMKVNVMSYSSGPNPTQSNDLMYTDCHPPFVSSSSRATSRPLSIWVLGKPGSGCDGLARKLALELGSGPTTSSSAAAVSLANGNGVHSIYHFREECAENLPLLTPEFLLAFAKEETIRYMELRKNHADGSNHIAETAFSTFPQIDELLARISSGSTLSSKELFDLFLFALHSDRLAFQGYILPASLDWLAGYLDRLAELHKEYPSLERRGVWPPQCIIDVEVAADEEIVAKVTRRRTMDIERRWGMAMGFIEEAEVEEEEIVLDTNEEENADGGADGSAASANDRPMSAALGGRLRSGSSAAGSLAGDDDAWDESSAGAGVGIGSEDGLGVGFLQSYPAWRSLHRFDQLSAEEFEHEEAAAFSALVPRTLPKAYLHGHALGGTSLESEADIEADLAEYASIVLPALRRLLSNWSSFHAEKSTCVQECKEAAQRTMPKMIHVRGDLPLADSLQNILHALGASKWNVVGDRPTHLKFVAKEELKSVEDDEVREVLILQNLQSKNPVMSKDNVASPNAGADGSAAGGGAEGEGTLLSIPMPRTADPSGLDLETAFLYADATSALELSLMDGSASSYWSRIRHHFSAFQTMCPVALRDMGKLIEGREDLAVTFQGQLYFLSSQHALQSFKQNPLVYTRRPPCLPANFTLAIVGAKKVGKTAIAKNFAEGFGWNLVDACSLGLAGDGDGGNMDEELANRIASITKHGGQHILDLGSLLSAPAQFDTLLNAGVEIDRLVYLYVDDVETLPGRLRAAKAPPPGSEEERKAKEAAAAAALEAAAAAAASTGKKKKGGKDLKSTTTSLGSGGTSDSEDTFTQEEENLMDLVDEFQNETWPNVLLPYLDERGVATSEVQSQPIVQQPTTTNNPTTASTSAATTAPTSPTASGASSSTAAVGECSPQQESPSSQAIRATFDRVRVVIDPFFSYRLFHSAQRITQEMVERSNSGEEKVSRGLQTPQIDISSQVGVGGNSAAAAAAQAASNSSHAENPRLLRYGYTNFCPVCLLGSNLLLPGNPEHGVSLGLYSYSCCSSECVTKFISNPALYDMHQTERMERLEPEPLAPRILVTGARGSGKSHAVDSLASLYNLTRSVSVSKHFYPMLRERVEQTLKEVEAKEEAEARRKAAAREAKRLARKEAREAKLAARAAARAEAGEDAAGESEEEVDEDEDDLSDSELGDGDGGESEGGFTTGDEVDAPKDKDILKLFLATPEEAHLEFHTILMELIDEEWIALEEMEAFLRSIFRKFSQDIPSNNKPVGWVCEVDLFHPTLLGLLQTIVTDPSEKASKPHVVIHVECSQKVGMKRLVSREQARRERVRVEEERSAAETGVGGGPNADSERGSNSARSMSSSVAAEKLRSKQRAKAEAAERAAREKAEREAKEREAAEKAKSNKKSKRFGKKKGQTDGDDGATASSSSSGLTKKSKKKQAEEAAAAAAEAEAAAKAAAEEAAREEARRAAEAEAAAGAAAAAGASSGASDLAAELAAEEARAAAARAMEELTNDMLELWTTSIESHDGFLLNLYAAHFVILQPVRTKGVASKNTGAITEKLKRSLKETLDPFFAAQGSLFHPFIPITSNDATKLVTYGLKSLRKYATLCPVCLQQDQTVYDCRPFIHNSTSASSFMVNPESFPLVWSQFVLFTCSRSHRAELVKSPRQFLQAHPPPPPVPTRAVVLRSGWDLGRASSKLVEKIAHEMNLVHVTIPQILERMIKEAENASRVPGGCTSLAREIATALKSGHVLSDRLLVSAVSFVLSQPNALAQGWILDGFPATPNQALMLRAAGVEVGEVISLRDAQSETQMKQDEQSKTSSVHDELSHALQRRESCLERIIHALEDLPSFAEAAAEAPPMEPEEEAVDDEEDEEGGSGGSGQVKPPPKRVKGISTLLPPGMDLEQFIEPFADIDIADKAATRTRSSSRMGMLAIERARCLDEQRQTESYFENTTHNVIRLCVGDGVHPAMEDKDKGDGSAVAAAPTPRLVFTGLRSLWQQSSTILSLLRDHSVHRASYRAATFCSSPTFTGSTPALIAALGGSRAQILRHASRFEDFCPVCFIDEQGKLNRSEHVVADTFTVEYQQRFYRTCSAKHLASFMAHPTSYAETAGQKSVLPLDRPWRLSNASMLARIERRHVSLYGFCPVTLYRSTNIEGVPRVIRGQPSCTVVYGSQVFQMAGEKEVQEFMSLPHIYSKVTLPYKMPVGARTDGLPPPPEVSGRSLLQMGKSLAFMQKDLQALLIRALNSFESLPSSSPTSVSLRPKYPAIPLSSSALLYLSLYLKAHNPSNQPWMREKYEEKLQLFLEHCQLIPNVAAHYRAADAQHDSNTKKEAEESKESETSEPTTKTLANPSFNEQAALYDKLRAEARAHAAGIGSRKNLKTFFQKYLR